MAEVTIRVEVGFTARVALTATVMVSVAAATTTAGRGWQVVGRVVGAGGMKIPYTHPNPPLIMASLTLTLTLTVIPTLPDLASPSRPPHTSP